MTLWYISLALGAGVIVVVALVLWLIAAEARKIRSSASAIWDGGQQIASQTVHIAALAHTNYRLRAIAGKVPVLLAVLGAIRKHASDCPGCPDCLSGGDS